MESALITINRKLLSAGLSQSEVDELMGRFLEEEAFDYVSAIASTIKKQLEEDREITYVS